MRAIRALKALPQPPSLPADAGRHERGTTGSTSTAYMATARGSSNSTSGTVTGRNVFRVHPTVTASHAVAKPADPECSPPSSMPDLSDEALELLTYDEKHVAPRPVPMLPASAMTPPSPDGRPPFVTSEPPVRPLPAFVPVLLAGVNNIGSVDLYPGVDRAVSSLVEGDVVKNESRDCVELAPFPEVPVTTHCRRTRLTRAQAMAKIAEYRRRAEVHN